MTLGEVTRPLDVPVEELDVERMAPRDLAPTSRQLKLGAANVATADETSQLAPPPRRVGVRQRLAFGFRERFDLRQVQGPRTPIVVFLLVGFFGGLTDLAFPILAPELRTSFAAAPVIIGVAAFAIPVAQYAVQPFYGWLVDRVKRVWLERIARIGGFGCTTVSAFAGTLPGYVGLNAAGGILGIGAQAPQATLMADYYEEEDLGRFSTLLQAATALSAVIGPLAIGFLAVLTNWRIAVLVLGCLAFAAGCTTLFLREPQRGAIDRRQMGAEELPEPPPLPFGESWRAARSIATLRRLWYATPFMVATSALPTQLVLSLYFAESFAVGAAGRGYLLALLGAVAFAALLMASPLVGRLLAAAPGRLLTLAAGLKVLQALALVVVASSTLLPLSVLATLPVAIGLAVVPALTGPISVKVVPPRIRGLGYSTLAPWTLAGLALFGLLLAAFGSTAGGARAVLAAMIPVQLVAAFFLGRAGSEVARDMRAARASVLAQQAEEEAREAGRAKLLVCRGVEVAYGGTQVLFGVDLDVQEGEVLALLGTNGAGKSTLLRAIAGVHEAANGAILVDGHDVTHEPAHLNTARGIVLMPGGRATFPTLTVEQNLRAATWLYRGDAAAVAAGIEQVLQFFPILRERLNSPAGDLSGGEQQMVGLGQAFLLRPRLLMIDELSLGLAPMVVDALLDIVRRIAADGTTVLLVEQSINLALTVAPRAVFMEKGEVRFDGPTEELLRHPELIRSVFIGGATAARRATTRRPSTPKTVSDAVLSVEDVRVRFGGLQALDGASLDVVPGEIVGVIGPNGAGKTTLFDVISGFTRADSGRVLLKDEDVTSRRPDQRARVGLARSFQSAKLFPALTVRENIAVALERRAVRSELMAALWLPQVRSSETKLLRRVDGLIELLGLDAFADKFAGELSTGSRRAVDVACVMAADPEVLLLDEPSSGLAQAETEALGPVLSRLAADTGCALLVIEHDLPLITSIADRLVAMELGRVVATGTPEQVMEDPAVLASYLAASTDALTRSDSRAGALSAAVLRSGNRSSSSAAERATSHNGAGN